MEDGLNPFQNGKSYQTIAELTNDAEERKRAEAQKLQQEQERDAEKRRLRRARLQSAARFSSAGGSQGQAEDDEDEYDDEYDEDKEEFINIFLEAPNAGHAELSAMEESVPNVAQPAGGACPPLVGNWVVLPTAAKETASSIPSSTCSSQVRPTWVWVWEKRTSSAHLSSTGCDSPWSVAGRCGVGSQCGRLANHAVEAVAPPQDLVDRAALTTAQRDAFDALPRRARGCVAADEVSQFNLGFGEMRNKVFGGGVDLMEKSTRDKFATYGAIRMLNRGGWNGYVSAEDFQHVYCAS